MKNILLRSRYMALALGLLLAAPALWSCNTETTLQKTLREHDETMRVIDEDTIQKYLARNQITNAVRTNSGLYLVPLVEGQGPPITAGKRVSVKYIGRLLSNGAQPGSTGYPASPGDSRFPAGSIFDNSFENRTACQCAVFTVGSNIAGFNEGLLLMKKGDRKLLLIPSRLAYGSTGQQGSIPPDSALLFDVEVVDVF
ncbi:FKBP-type peptidyl-prolyl cis-trans isomerase [Hymenobacter sp. BT683]|uniref:Peptidyl-prolyl cis-trans isomerase n=1 Tax=Hymenobacter jeongseonensis TaxID=2791027 RepID=A0ABS0IFH8_9BACT|nr:FKBP-type peptidyl-prolyl cis-trans isomerase [Hymenobacter jeongseonensis]MBF9237116.1 FKBP-type peptidyl-prolyl cis-trans isomerase [Hymenobacter jeongseonensis]